MRPQLSFASIFVLSVALAVCVAPAQAQNRLALEVGPLLPVGDMADRFDTSLWLGARFEFQEVNALGQAASLSVYGRGGFALLNVGSDYEGALAQLGLDADASYFDLGLGARAYSTASPFFVSASASYGRFDSDAGDGQNAFTPSIGLGMSFAFDAAVVDIEGRGHLAFVQDTDNLQFFTITGSVGFPF